MFATAGRLISPSATAPDELTGRAKKSFFDEQSPAMRDAAADAGGRLPDRAVPISPFSVTQLLPSSKKVDIVLTRHQVKGNLEIDTHQSISRQQKRNSSVITPTRSFRQATTEAAMRTIFLMNLHGSFAIGMRAHSTGGRGAKKRWSPSPGQSASIGIPKPCPPGCCARKPKTTLPEMKCRLLTGAVSNACMILTTARNTGTKLSPAVRRCH
jgi:hypothetical protein